MLFGYDDDVYGGRWAEWRDLVTSVCVYGDRGELEDPSSSVAGMCCRSRGPWLEILAHITSWASVMLARLRDAVCSSPNRTIEHIYMPAGSTYLGPVQLTPLRNKHKGESSASAASKMAVHEVSSPLLHTYRHVTTNLLDQFPKKLSYPVCPVS